MRKLAIALALASTALAAPAVARDGVGYVGAEIGGMIVEDTVLDFDTTTRQIDNAFIINHNYGVDADVIAGYDFGAFRGEVELGYKRASIDSIAPSAAVTTTAITGDGNVRVWSAMANALVDFGDDSGWSGYVGGGLGLASVRYNLDPNSVAVFGGNDFSDSDSGLAWQGIAGVRHAITDNIDLGLKYRYFNASKLDFSDAPGNLNGRFRSHSLLASLIFNFAPPPPPPVVVAPPPPPPPATESVTGVGADAEPSLVFFDWDKAEVTRDAASILEAVATSIGKTGAVQIVLTGHADRSGTEAYNLDLSRRRAEAVRAFLVERGLSDSAITVLAMGEQQPIIATADGVREVQNRRVEVRSGPGSTR